MTVDSLPARHIMEEVAIVYGFSVKDGCAKAFTGGDAIPDDCDYVWVHINLASESGAHWAAQNAGLAPQLNSTFCSRDEDLGVYPFGSGIMLVLEDRLKAFDHDELELAPLHVWIESKRVITARWHALAATDRLRFRFQVGAAPKTTVGLTAELLDEIVTDVENIARKIGTQVDHLEDRILDGEIGAMAAAIGALRRQIIRLRRHVLPLKQVIHKVIADFPSWASDDDHKRIDILHSRIERTGSEIIEAQEQARLLNDENFARNTERSGRNLYVLTVFTALILPLNLITGFFGMNVQGIPGVNQEGGFEWVSVGMIVVFLITLVIFKIKRWF